MPAATSFLDDSDNGPFVIFNSDFCPRNMLVNRQTAEITAVVGFEFTNTMPASFAHDPPLWLIPTVLEKTLDMDFFPWWLQEYQPAVERFFTSMERVEARHQQQQQRDQGQPLPALMRASWDNKQCLVMRFDSELPQALNCIEILLLLHLTRASEKWEQAAFASGVKCIDGCPGCGSCTGIWYGW